MQNLKNCQNKKIKNSKIQGMHIYIVPYFLVLKINKNCKMYKFKLVIRHSTKATKIRPQITRMKYHLKVSKRYNYKVLIIKIKRSLLMTKRKKQIQIKHQRRH